MLCVLCVPCCATLCCRYGFTDPTGDLVLSQFRSALLRFDPAIGPDRDMLMVGRAALRHAMLHCAVIHHATLCCAVHVPMNASAAAHGMYMPKRDRMHHTVGLHWTARLVPPCPWYLEAWWGNPWLQPRWQRGRTVSDPYTVCAGPRSRVWPLQEPRRRQHPLACLRCC